MKMMVLPEHNAGYVGNITSNKKSNSHRFVAMSAYQATQLRHPAVQPYHEHHEHEGKLLIKLQGDKSGCSQGCVDIKARVVL